MSKATTPSKAVNLDEAVERLTKFASAWPMWKWTDSTNRYLRTVLSALSASNARAEAAEERVEKLVTMRPAPYDITDQDHMLRLVREVHGYLTTCRGKCGSDIDGRAHAIDALAAISEALVARTTLASMTEKG